MYESSDSEFWEHLEDKIDLNKKEPKKTLEVLQNIEEPKPEPETKPEKRLKKKPGQNFWDFDRQKILTERIITAGLQKAKEEEIRVKNQTKKEFYPIIQETIYNFQKDIAQMVVQHELLKERLREIENYMLKIEDTLNHQYKATAKMEIFLHKEKHLNYNKQKAKDCPLIQEIFIVESQVSCLRQVTAEYSKDAEKVSDSVKKIEEKIVLMKETQMNKITKLKNFYMQKENAIYEDIEKIKARFANYKLRAELELDLRDVIKKRQMDFMGKLYTELGNSKFIIQNPRLRMQFHRKVNRVSGSQEQGEENVERRNELLSRCTKYSDGRESFSLAQTRPVTNDLKIGPKKFDDDDPFTFHVVTRIRNSVTPFR